LRRESIEAVVKEEVGEAKIQVIEFVLRQSFIDVCICWFNDVGFLLLLYF
jgi:hypothetical protein